jgi:uncharacterized Zn-finger protein
MADTEGLAVVEVAPRDLPVFCPNPQMSLWSSHPRVFLDIAETGEALCPYCGTRYRLTGGPRKGGGH